MALDTNTNDLMLDIQKDCEQTLQKVWRHFHQRSKLKLLSNADELGVIFSRDLC